MQIRAVPQPTFQIEWSGKIDNLVKQIKMEEAFLSLFFSGRNDQLFREFPLQI
jgi:hypothetical protein